MKRIVLFSWCFFIFLGVHAQEKELDKVQKYLTQQKYEKIVDLCNKALSDPVLRKIPDFYLYKAYAQFKQLDSSATGYSKQLSFCLQAAAKGVTYDKEKLIFSKTNPVFSILLNAGHRQAELNFYSNKETVAKSLETLMVKHFKDTSDLYRRLYNLQPPAVAIAEVAPPVIRLNASSLKADSLVYFASTLVGASYAFGKEGPDAFDCSGFIGYVFKHYDKVLPHNANMISSLGNEIPLTEIQKGDLVFFGTKSAYHVAMYVSSPDELPKIIHCVYKGVSIDEFTDQSYWGKSNVYKVKRLLP